MPPPKSHYWLFSRQCYLCDLEPGSPFLCQACHNDLPWLEHRCPCCALPQPLNSQTVCGQCLTSPPQWQQIFAACHYEFPINELISRAKYEQRLHFIPLLADLLLSVVPAQQRQADLILPVPMSRHKLKRRKVNHAWLLAKEIGKQLDIEVCQRRLRKTRDTGQQKDLNRAARQRNLRGSFAVSGALPERVIIVDDVMTTGTTMAEIARLLTTHGVQHISGWVVARTPN